MDDELSLETTAPGAPVTATAALACPWCSGPVDVKSPHVAVAGSQVRVYCSAACLEAWAIGPIDMLTPVPAPAPRFLWPRVLTIAMGLGLLTVDRADPLGLERVVPVVQLTQVLAAALAPPPPPAPVAAPTPPPDPLAATRAAEAHLDTAWMSELSRDTWFHPLAGPTRAMPHNHAQAFGAERAGLRPAQCESGHCGVDVGGNLWGEPVRAAHEGVVAVVNRGPNEDNGGVYVKIAHRDGLVFTWYFHLAAVPRWITPGTHVEAGQVVGLLGDTGVKRSAPHLHFAITVKPSPEAPEHYLDPEPLLAIWPLWVPDGERGQRVSTKEPPGVPVRGRRQAKARPAAAPAAPSATQAAAPTPAAIDSVPAAPPAP